MHEDEVIEICSFGGDVREINVGLDHAEALARGRFLAGRLTVEEYEAEVERLLLARAAR